ncbi:hypothetical protein D3C71_1276870 [compost metagenome]
MRLQPGHPCAVRPQLGPASSAQGQYHGIRRQRKQAFRRLEAQRPRVHRAPWRPAQPPVPHVKPDTAGAQSCQPGAQQGRGFHFLRKDTPRRPHERVDAQLVRPIPQRRRIHRLQPRGKLRGPLAIARQERRRGFAMCQVQPAPTRHQEFASDRGHGVEHVNLQAFSGQSFRRHQAGRAAADDGNAKSIARRRGGHCTRPVRTGRDLGRGQGMRAHGLIKSGEKRQKKHAARSGEELSHGPCEQGAQRPHQTYPSTRKRPGAGQ